MGEMKTTLELKLKREMSTIYRLPGASLTHSDTPHITIAYGILIRQ